MNLYNSKSILLSNSFTSNTQEKICNALGCSQLAKTAISLKIGENLLQYLFVKSVNQNLKIEQHDDSIIIVIQYKKYEV